jgi:RimJ/RimL family protein N-acetyltransferase
MAGTTFDVDLRPATLDDAGRVADLDTLRDPDEPRDPVLLRHWWRMTDEIETTMRRIAVRDGAVVAFVGASHEPWRDGEQRYGTIRLSVRPDEFTPARYAGLVELAERWLGGEGAAISVARVKDGERELPALEEIGYAEDRRQRTSELDLVANRQRLLAGRDKSRERMRSQAVRILPLSEDRDGMRMQKLYEAITESEKDVPTTVPWHALDFEAWRRFWFENPAIREDQFWIARDGDDIVGASVLDSPVVRGVPWTGYTGTVRRVRGRGIARALKYESIGQAIEQGHKRVRTNNDADNPAILRINEEMGYRLVAPIVELHRTLPR